MSVNHLSPRVLTLWQPWATFMAVGIKKYKTRQRVYRQDSAVYIHAAKRRIKAEEKLVYYKVQEEIEALKQEWPELIIPELPEIEDLPYGDILATTEFNECMLMVPGFNEMRPGSISISDQSIIERLCGNWKPGRYAWDFFNQMKLGHPIPFIGRQGMPFASLELVEQVGLSQKQPIQTIALLDHLDLKQISYKKSRKILQQTE